MTLLIAGVGIEGGRHPDQLHDGQSGGQWQVEQGHRLSIDLHLEGGVPEAAKDQHHTERGEGEQEHDGGGGGDRRS